MAISRTEVEKVALLARLEFSDEELDRMTSQMGEILGYFDLLSELDTAHVEPMAHAADITDALADDVPAQSLDREAALGNAPDRDESCFLVPPVLGE